MYVSKKITAAIITGFIVLAIPGIASAHVVVRPKQVDVAAYQTFTISVPNEKDVPVTAMRLLLPSGLRSATPTVKPGWVISTVKQGEVVTEITWTGGSIPAGQRDDFTFSAQAPDKTMTLQWKAYQTYGDSSVASWDQTPSSGHSEEEDSDKGPYSTTEIVNDLSAVDDADKQNDNTNSKGAYIIAMSSLLLSIVAITLKRRK